MRTGGAEDGPDAREGDGPPADQSALRGGAYVGPSARGAAEA